MTKEKWMEMGLSEEWAVKVMEGIDGAFVPKSRFNAVNGELQTARGALKELEKKKDEAHAAELAKLQTDYAVDRILTERGARNVRLVKTLLSEFLQGATLSEDGTVCGLEAEVEKLAAGEDTCFLFQKEMGGLPISGASPVGGIGAPPDLKSSGYQNRLAEARKNGNSLEAIKIKQEAAANGVVLL